MPAEILAAKLFIPPLRADFVPRPRLVTRLQAGLSRKLTLLCTPAGFGKTTLLSEWISKYDLRAAWISLDAGDNDLGRFISYLFAALHLSKEMGTLSIPRSSVRKLKIESLLTRLINGMEKKSMGGVTLLILDDYYVIHNPAIHQAVTFLLEHNPRGLHLVITTRTDPPLPLGQLRAHQQLNELRAQDLRFTREEAHSFLNDICGLGLSDSHVAALEGRTEGWIAGLQLATLAMSGRRDVDEFVRSFVGSHRYVLDYLTDEVLNIQTSDLQIFLLKTSILERMNASLCNAVTENSNGQNTLEMLERENLFIVPLDDERNWYRYHQLFSELLRFRLKSALPEPSILALHRRAAEWGARNGQTYEAIGHALNAKDNTLAIRVVQEASPVLAMRGGVNNLLTWLNALPRELRESNANLMLISAWAHLFMMDIGAVDTFVKNILRVMQASDFDSLPDATAIRGQVSALQVFVEVYRGRPERGIELAQAALKLLPSDINIGRYSVYAALGDAYRDMDDFASANSIYIESAKAFDAMGQSVASHAMKMDAARLRARMGQLREAERICREVIAQSGEGTQPTFPVAQAYILLGDLLREWNELEKARAILETGIHQCESGGYLRYLVTGHATLARVHFARGDFHEMNQSLERAATIARDAGVESLLVYAEGERVRLEKARGAESGSGWDWTRGGESDGAWTFSREHECLVAVRVQIQEEKIIGGLNQLLEAATAAGRMGSVVEILMLKSLAFYAQGKLADAFDVLHKALKIAEPQGYIRLFADEGAVMAELLKLFAQRGVQRGYIGRLLQVMGTELPAVLQTPVVELLTERELEILRLINLGLSNQDIAQKLTLSVTTVKTHVAHLFDNLGVKSRTQALVEARERGLL